jgi:hypothetical protein
MNTRNQISLAYYFPQVHLIPSFGGFALMSLVGWNKIIGITSCKSSELIPSFMKWYPISQLSYQVFYYGFTHPINGKYLR